MSTAEAGFFRVADLNELPTDGKLCLEVDERFVVLVRIGSEFFCLDDICTHDGGTFGDGPLEGNCLVCPRHGAKFDVRTGEAVVMPATEPTTVHEVKVVGTEIFVKLTSM